MKLRDFKKIDLLQELKYIPSSYHFLFYMGRIEFVYSNLNDYLKKKMIHKPILNEQELN